MTMSDNVIVVHCNHNIIVQYLNSKHCRAPESLKYIVAGVPLHAMLPGLQTTTHFNLSSASTVMKALRNASVQTQDDVTITRLGGGCQYGPSSRFEYCAADCRERLFFWSLS